MAQKLSLASTQPILSGYEIPVLGYGVSRKGDFSSYKYNELTQSCSYTKCMWKPIVGTRVGLMVVLDQVTLLKMSPTRL